MSDITTIIALLVSALIGLGLGALLRPRTASKAAPVERPKPVPDTTFEKEDDDAHATDVAAATTDADPTVGDAVDSVIADLRARREDR